MQAKRDLDLQLQELEAKNCVLWSFLLLTILWFVLAIMYFLIKDFSLIVVGAFVSPMILVLPFGIKIQRERKRQAQF